MIGHTADTIKIRFMFHDVAVNIGIQFTFMLLINSREAAMSSEDDMIDKMGITHDGTKVRRMLQLHKTFQAMGSPEATIILYRNTRGDDDSLATLSRQHHHGLLRWPPFGRLPHSSRVIQMAALRASATSHGTLTGMSSGVCHS